jgi:HK97 family phage major capsid protein
MWSRLYAPSRPNSVWLINQDVEPELHKMGLETKTPIAGALVYMPPGGLSQAPYGTLMGRPVIPIEVCQTMGTSGDIILADLSQYILIDKGGLQSASSIHFKFTTDETAFRFVFRVDGQPWWSTALVPFKGTSNTLSPFVVLS